MRTFALLPSSLSGRPQSHIIALVVPHSLHDKRKDFCPTLARSVCATQLDAAVTQCSCQPALGPPLLLPESDGPILKIHCCPPPLKMPSLEMSPLNKGLPRVAAAPMPTPPSLCCGFSSPALPPLLCPTPTSTPTSTPAPQKATPRPSCCCTLPHRHQAIRAHSLTSWNSGALKASASAPISAPACSAKRNALSRSSPSPSPARTQMMAALKRTHERAYILLSMYPPRGQRAAGQGRLWRRHRRIACQRWCGRMQHWCAPMPGGWLHSWEPLFQIRRTLLGTDASRALALCPGILCKQARLNMRAHSATRQPPTCPIGGTVLAALCCRPGLHLSNELPCGGQPCGAGDAAHALDALQVAAFELQLQKRRLQLWLIWPVAAPTWNSCHGALLLELLRKLLCKLDWMHEQRRPKTHSGATLAAMPPGGGAQ